MNNKKGQQMTLGTIIAIVLGLVVLVFLIFGFSTGWSNMWQRISGYSGTSNVDTIVDSCTLACSSQRVNDYCTEIRTVKFSDKHTESGSCQALAGVATDDFTNVNGQVIFGKSTNISISKCPNLCTGINVTTIKVK